ncbi:MAG: hypothetical protein NTY19_51160 [Planctomycetota bacterium]|nr:hypothetical protein [Planctomycetota bacterium]
MHQSLQGATFHVEHMIPRQSWAFGGLGLLGILFTEARWINLTREHVIFRTLENSGTGKWGTGK